MSGKSFIIDSVGEVVVQKHPTTRKMSIKMRANKPPKVIIPEGFPYSVGCEFALSRIEWILETREKINQRVVKNIYDQDNPFVFRNKQVTFVKCDIKCVQMRKEGENYVVSFPKQTNFATTEAQDFVKRIVVEVMRIEAKVYMPQRVKMLAEKYGFRYNKVTVKDICSRWGSCSVANNINLSVHLMRLPEYLSDFIILHELCHTIHKNHGEGFHALLDSLVGGKEKQLDKELRKYNIHN